MRAAAADAGWERAVIDRFEPRQDLTRLREAVIQRREALHLTQYRLATRLGLAPHTVSRLERGETLRPSLEELAALARFLDMDLNQIGVLVGVWPERPEQYPLLAEPLRMALSYVVSLAQTMTAEGQARLATAIRVAASLTRLDNDPSVH